LKSLPPGVFIHREEIMEAKVSPALVVIILLVVASILVMVYFSMIVKPRPNAAPDAPAAVAGAPKMAAPPASKPAAVEVGNPLPVADPAVINKVKDKAAAAKAPLSGSEPANQLPAAPAPR
jgi:hypothetical protein